MTTNRRQFLGTALAAGALARRGFAQATGAAPEKASAAQAELDGNRFLTFNTLVRVNQIEAGRDQLIGMDEAAVHTPETARLFRETFTKRWPGARVTWAFSWLALQDKRENYRDIRALVAEYRKGHGDDVTFIPGGYFANMHNTRAQVDADIHEGLAMAEAISGAKPQSLVAGFLAAENLRHLCEREGVPVCQGNIWSQYAIDNGDGEGSICYPYYPSTEHFCKPAQGAGDIIPCVNLDGWTCDFVSARRTGTSERHNSRMGVGPIETFMNLGRETGMREALATVAAHFDAGFALNGFAWVTTCWEQCLLGNKPKPRQKLLDCMSGWLDAIRERWPSSQCVTQGEFGRAWMRRHKDNSAFDYRFVQRGTGIHGSDENLEIRWFMNKDFRLALLRDWKANGPETAIDFTRYDLPAREPADLGRNWSLMNRLNQKGSRPQDKPLPLAEFSAEEKALIVKRHPELI